MLLFIISIEPQSRKILSSTKIQGISLGKSNLKVSHYADNLTFFITSPTLFYLSVRYLIIFQTFLVSKLNYHLQFHYSPILILLYISPR